jgi:transcriptional regulator with XRE-family HTH domain
MTSKAGEVFWRDLARDLQDPEFLREYVVESLRIATIDRIVNALDQAREAAGLSKAELARAIGSQPQVIRRLFTSHAASPTLGTLAEVAGALGMRVTLTPMDESERKDVTGPLLEGRTADAEGLAKHLAEMRQSKSRELVPC